MVCDLLDVRYSSVAKERRACLAISVAVMYMLKILVLCLQVLSPDDVTVTGAGSGIGNWSGRLGWVWL